MEDEVGWDDVPLNAGDQYDTDHYWEEEAYLGYEHWIGIMQQMIQEEKEFGGIWDLADELAEIEYFIEVEEEQRFLDLNPMEKFDRYIQAITEMGSYPDRHDYYEAMDLQSKEIIDEVVDQDIPQEVYNAKDSY